MSKHTKNTHNNSKHKTTSSKISSKLPKISKSNMNFTSTLMFLQEKFSKKLLILITVLSLLVFTIVFLYGPAKEYYINLRYHDKLQAQHDAIAQTNKNLNDDIAFVQTPEGVKQKANENLGLLEQGEQTGVVSGLDSSVEEKYNNSNSKNSKQSYKTVKAPETWYSPFCDFIFGIK